MNRRKDGKMTVNQAGARGGNRNSPAQQAARKRNAAKARRVKLARKAERDGVLTLYPDET